MFEQHGSEEVFDRYLAKNLKNLCSSSASGHVQSTAKDCGRKLFSNELEGKMLEVALQGWRIIYRARKEIGTEGSPSMENKTSMNSIDSIELAKALEPLILTYP